MSLPHYRGQPCCPNAAGPTHQERRMTMSFTACTEKSTPVWFPPHSTPQTRKRKSSDYFLLSRKGQWTETGKSASHLKDVSALCSKQPDSFYNSNRLWQIPGLPLTLVTQAQGHWVKEVYRAWCLEWNLPIRVGAGGVPLSASCWKYEGKSESLSSRFSPLSRREVRDCHPCYGLALGGSQAYRSEGLLSTEAMQVHQGTLNEGKQEPVRAYMFHVKRKQRGREGIKAVMQRLGLNRSPTAPSLFKHWFWHTINCSKQKIRNCTLYSTRYLNFNSHTTLSSCGVLALELTASLLLFLRFGASPSDAQGLLRALNSGNTPGGAWENI